MSNTYYITQSGNGLANGTTDVNAWAVSSFNNSTNWSSTADTIGKISPGDTVLIIGSISSSLVVQGNGSLNSPITIQYAKDGKSSNSNWGIESSSAIVLSNKKYIVIDGGTNGVIENTANGDGLTNQKPSTGIYILNSSNVEIKNLTIRNIYTHIYNTNNVVSAYATQCIKISGSSNISIHDCKLNNAYVAIYYFTESPGVLSALDIHDNIISACSTDIIASLGGSSSSMDTISIHRNDITMGLNWFDNPDANHIDGIHCWTGTNGNITNLKIFDNYIHDDCSTHCTGFIFLEGQIVSPEIYNNLLVGKNNHPMGGYINPNIYGTNPAYIHDNTIIGLSSNNTGGIGINAGGKGDCTLKLRNNIFSNVFIAYYDSDNAVRIPLDSDNNNFFNCGNIGWRGAAHSANLASWQTSISQDKNSLSLDPQFDSGFIPTNALVKIGAIVTWFFSPVVVVPPVAPIPNIPTPPPIIVVTPPVVPIPPVVVTPPIIAPSPVPIPAPIPVPIVATKSWWQRFVCRYFHKC